MKITDQKTEERQELLTIEIEPSEVEEAKEKAFQRISKDVEVPGFRKGKAPKSVLEQHIGKDKLFEEALNIMVPKACSDAINEKDIKPIAEPSIKLTKEDPVTIEVKVPLEPIIKLGDYKSIRIDYKPVEIQKEEVDKALEDLQHNRAAYEPVDRPADLKDLLVIDINAVTDGETILDQKGTNYYLVSDLSYPAPGFPEELIGMKKDDEKEFTLKLSKNFHKREFAEKDAIFKVKVNEIKEERLPELTDEFAKSLGADIESMDMLKERIENNMKSSADEKARSVYEEQLMDTLIEKSELEFPPVMVEMEINNLVSQYMQQLQMGARDKEHYQKMLERIPQDEMRKEYRPVAIKRVSASLALHKVAEEEKVEVTDADIDAEIEKMTQNSGDKKEEQKQFFNNPQNRNYIKQMLTTQKTVQLLIDIAKGSAGKETKPEKEEEK